MEWGSLFLFLLVYFGMILGNWPGLAIDRTGIALLGAIAFIEFQNIPLARIPNYIDLSALAILFSFMIISAQFYFSGFYTRVVEWIEKWKLDPPKLLFVIIFISGALSAVLINDIVCLAFAPLITRGCLRKKLNPVPFLIGLASASNIGSALTLIGNPQNLLIGSVLSIPFAGYLKYSMIPSFLGLFAVWMIIKWQSKDDWHYEGEKVDFNETAFNFWQSSKGLIVILILVLIFFFFDLPRDKVSLIAAGCLLLSRRMASQTMLSFVDWQLLVLFIGLFIVNGAFLETGTFDSLSRALANRGIDLSSPFWIFISSSILSSIVSNVPAVMLLLPFAKTTFAGSLLALSSTLAGNLLVVGSISNVIVFFQAARFGIKINWKRHLRTGLPVTLMTLMIAAVWLYVVS